MKDRIIEMLGNGIPATAVAAALGCTDSYISQLLTEDGVVEQVQALRAVKFQEYAEQDARLETAEQKALNKIESLIPYITKPSEAARVYGILNAAKRKTGVHATQNSQVGTVVQLNLPQAAVVSFTLTSDKQVVEVEGRSMVTMPAKSLAARLEQRNAARLLTADVPKFLDVPQSLVASKL